MTRAARTVSRPRQPVPARRLQIVDPCVSPLWEAFVGTRPSSVFHSPAWLRVLRASHGFEVNGLVLLGDAGAPVAGVPFVHLQDLRGERIVSLPFSDHCDPLVADAAAWDTLAGYLGVWGCPVSVRTLRSAPARSDPRFQPGKAALWHGLDLRRGESAIWQGLSGSARSRIRQAWKGGVTVREGRSEQDLRTFYDMLLRLRKRKYGLLCQPFGFYREIFERFVVPGHGVLLLAEVDGRPAAATLYLVWQDVLTYKFNASEPDALALRPNDLLVWEGIRYGLARGLRELDFGLSDSDQEGLVRYKRKFADQERELWTQRWVPDPRRAPPAWDVQPMLDAVVRLVTREGVPDVVTEEAGAALYRYFA